MLHDDPRTSLGHEDLPDADELLGALPKTLNTYSSPVLKRMVKEQLTLSFLAAKVPIFQAGEAAEARLADTENPVTIPQQRDALIREVAEGKRALDDLVRVSIPLVRLLANKEFDKRGGPQGRIRTTRDEMFQEGMIGLMSGLRKYNPSGSQNSPTNYLGSWIGVAFRRNTDSSEHDFTLGYGLAERFRRIHAIRSRLHGELGRPPTDAEIIAAWTDRRYQPNRMMGRLDRSDEDPKNVVTRKQLDEERQYRDKMGVKAMPVDDDGTSHAFDEATPVDSYGPPTADEEVITSDAQRFMKDLFYKTLDLLQVGKLQRHVINLKFGLDGFDEHPVASIVLATKLSRPKVTNVIDAFTSEMTKKNGAFHQVCSRVDPEDLMSCGLEWVRPVLGDYTFTPVDPPAVLTAPLTTTDGKPPPPPLRAHEKPGQIRAQFQCPVHKSSFVGAYRGPGEVPASRACPRCGTAAPVIRVLET